MNPIESLFVDDQETSPGRLVLPDMSLSSQRQAMRRHSFAIRIRTHSMVDILESSYGDMVRELQADDRQLGGPQDALAEAGYPDLADLPHHPAALNLVVASYLLEELLGPHLWDGSEDAAYWLDRADECYETGEFIVITGACYS